MRAAIYCRLSEEDRDKRLQTDDSGSIQNQKAMLTQYALEQGWEICDIYSDDDYAGADRRRPEFNRLLEDAERRRFDIVLCKTQSRFTRELELVEKYIHGLFPLWGVRFVSVVDNADTASLGNKKSRQINGLVNEWYLEDMSENIRSVLTSRRKSGLHIGAFALYGYRKDPERKGCLLVDEEAAAVVREVFTLFAGGYGKTAIARMLNDRGIPNPTEYKRLCGLRYGQGRPGNSTLWQYSAIADMLTNEMYIGNMVQGRYGSASYKTKRNRPRPREEWYVVEGTHEPIIDRELWDSVQALLAQRAKPFGGGAIGLFARRARCMDCGRVLRSSRSHGRSYLQCPSRHVSRDACGGAFVSVESLEEAVAAELNRLAAAYLDREALARSCKSVGGPEEERARVRADLAVLERKRAEYLKGLRELYLDKGRGLVAEEDFTKLAADFAAERERLERAAADVRARLAKIPDEAGADTEPWDPLERYAAPGRLRREVVDALIDHISVGRRPPGAGEVPVEIHWSF